MAVTGTEPISAGNLDGLFPVPIALGGTGATTADNAIVTLGIDTFVQQAVENYFDVQGASWSGTGAIHLMPEESLHGSENFMFSQSADSADIKLLSNTVLYIAKAGTYRFSGGVSGTILGGYSGSGTSYVRISTGQQIGSASVNGTSLRGNVLGSATFSGATQFSVMLSYSGYYNNTNLQQTIGLNNFSIQRIA